MTIRLISFDLDDTLWLNDGVIERAQLKMFEALDTLLKLQNKQPAQMTHERWASFTQTVRDDHPELAHDMTALRKQCISQYLSDQGFQDLESVAQYTDHIFNALWQERIQVSPFETVKPILSQLKKDFKIAALTTVSYTHLTLPTTPYV